MPTELPILNLETAKFDCTFGRGCDGVCCREGRPPVYPEEIETIAANLEKFLSRLRPDARAVVARDGFMVPRLRRHGELVPRVVDGWCVFFNRGCVLHQVGAEEGDAYRYKPSLCSLFPIQQDDAGNWFVRQKGYKGERWDLPCLDPAGTAVAARDSLEGEIALATRFDEKDRAAGGGTAAPP